MQARCWRPEPPDRCCCWQQCQPAARQARRRRGESGCCAGHQHRRAEAGRRFRPDPAGHARDSLVRPAGARPAPARAAGRGGHARRVPVGQQVRRPVRPAAVRYLRAGALPVPVRDHRHCLCRWPGCQRFRHGRRIRQRAVSPAARVQRPGGPGQARPAGQAGHPDSRNYRLAAAARKPGQVRAVDSRPDQLLDLRQRCPAHARALSRRAAERGPDGQPDARRLRQAVRPHLALPEGRHRRRPDDRNRHPRQRAALER